MHTLKFDWNPNTGIDIFGNFKIYYYSLMWVVAFILGWYIMKRIFTKEKVNIEFLDPLFIYTVLATMIGARLGHVIFYQAELIKEDFFSIFLPFRFNPEFQFTGFQGLASHGAAIGIIIGMYLYRRKYNYKSLMWILDRIVIPVASGAIFIRIGNFINSEIIGKITDSAWGVRFVQDFYGKREIMQKTGIDNAKDAFAAVTDNSQFQNLLEAVPYRHPTQLYEAFCYFLMFWVLWFVYTKTDKGNKPGFLFGLFLVLLWTIRFFIEFLKEPQVADREDYVSFMNTGQLLSVPFILIGFYFIFKKATSTTN
ncbi:MAG: prolipoprotein diacylglyceryl transferase [Bacteroidia bacterium]|nr:prolipoprotein diacylglyceryl transferase [Bacteroidia bacterium]MBT8309935.1 prolipoprotein diacylglyceryl transferase [Bacteroidia bacterium]NNK27763.1 prolipoprotein diacylglyceryl transferase [Flavobacteriaceae bacterium]NNL61472.1 prolipoprotein diacylglyceryl transferase [Flavobacteriaceae bacterium]